MTLEQGHAQPDGHPASVTVRIEALAARIQALLAPNSEEHTAPPGVVASPLDGVLGGSEGRPVAADLGDQIAYLQSALAQRSVEAEDWRSADRDARLSLEETRTALEQAEVRLARERKARADAEKEVARLKDELETLTRLLEEVEAREALRIEAATAEAKEASEARIAELEATLRGLAGEADAWAHARGELEAALAEEKVRTDQYRDVSQKMQALCVHQATELNLLRVQNRDSQAEVERQKGDIERLAHNYRKIRQTTSWKATAPVRKLFRVFKGAPKT